MKTFEPDYNTYFKRSIEFIKRLFIVFSFIPLLALFINRNRRDFLIGCLVSIVFLFFAFIRALIINKYLLRKIDFDLENNLVYVSVYKYNELWKNDKYDFNLFDVKVVESLESKYKSFWLELYNEKKIVYRQKEAGGWSALKFKELYEYIRNEQNRPAYTNYINTRDDFV
jgi:hypothetical protein